MCDDYTELHARFQYDFRPETYWDESAVHANVGGQWRRERIEQATKDGTVEELPPELFGDLLSDGAASTRRGQPGGFSPKMAAMAGLLSGRAPDDPCAAAGAIHPGCLGGEFLPDYEHDEVEIARVVYASAGGDVTSIRARRIGSRIAYSIVDDHGSQYEVSIPFSSVPLTFGQIIRQVNWSDNLSLGDEWIGGLVLAPSNNVVMNGGDPNSVVNFARVESEFYPQLGEWFERLFDVWIADRQPGGEYEAEHTFFQGVG